MILLEKIHILLRSCYKWTEHAVCFPHGTISFKTGENVVHMSQGKAAMFSLCLYLIANGCFYARKHNSTIPVEWKMSLSDGMRPRTYSG